MRDDSPGIGPRPEGPQTPADSPEPPEDYVISLGPEAPPREAEALPVLPTLPASETEVVLEPGVGGSAPPMTSALGTSIYFRRWDGRPMPLDFEDTKMIAGVLGILLGGWGAHKFALGYKVEGAVMAGVSLLSWFLTLFTFVGWIGVLGMWVVGVVEGVIYLTKPDDEFVTAYGLNKRAWF